MKTFLEELSILLSKHNVSIRSTKGSVGFIKNIHEPDRVDVISGRNMVNSYDTTFIINNVLKN